MRFLVAVAALAGIASASVSGLPVDPDMASILTEVVNGYVTYCPEPTTLTYGTQTYTVTAPTSLTFTEPCTVTRTLTSSTVTDCTACPTGTPTGTGAVPTGTGVSPTGGVTSIYTPPTYPNSTAAQPPMGTASGTGSMTAPLPTFTGAASHAVVGAGASLAGLLGLAAILL